METPNHPDPSARSEASPRVGRKRIRTIKESMSGIELRRRTMRIRLAVAGVAGLVAVLIAVVVAVYPGSDHFRGRFDQMLSNSTGARATVSNAEFSAFHASADAIELRWPEGNTLAELKVEELAATVLPQRHFAGRYGGAEARGKTGSLRLQYPAADGPAVHQQGEAGKSRIHFNRFGIRNLDVFFGDPELMAGAAILDSEAAFYPEGPGGAPRALLYSGTLVLPLWPEFILERAILEFPADDTCRISSLRLRDSEVDINSEILPGICDISGEVALGADRESTLDLKFESFQIQSILGEIPGRIFMGRVDTRPGGGLVRISGKEGLHMRAEVIASDQSQLVFSHFPFLNFLAMSLEDETFATPFFDETSSLVVIRDSSGIRFESIQLNATRHMAIRGYFSIDIDDMISGEIEVGVSPNIIETSPTRRLDGMFSPDREGFRWVTLTLGGTASRPTDNIDTLFINAPLSAPYVVSPSQGLEPEPEPEPTEPGATDAD